MRCREEARYGGRDKGKERGLLLAFRWFHMKSPGAHLGCRHRRPTSHLLPLGLPEFGLVAPAHPRHAQIKTGAFVSTYFRWFDCTATLFLFPLNGFLLLHEESLLGLRLLVRLGFIPSALKLVSGVR